MKRLLSGGEHPCFQRQLGLLNLLGAELGVCELSAALFRPALRCFEAVVFARALPQGADCAAARERERQRDREKGGRGREREREREGEAAARTAQLCMVNER